MQLALIKRKPDRGFDLKADIRVRARNDLFFAEFEKDKRLIAHQFGDVDFRRKASLAFLSRNSHVFWAHAERGSLLTPKRRELSLIQGQREITMGEFAFRLGHPSLQKVHARTADET